MSQWAIARLPRTVTFDEATAILAASLGQSHERHRVPHGDATFPVVRFPRPEVGHPPTDPTFFRCLFTAADHHQLVGGRPSWECTWWWEGEWPDGNGGYIRPVDGTVLTAGTDLTSVVLLDRLAWLVGGSVIYTDEVDDETTYDRHAPAREVGDPDWADFLAEVGPITNEDLARVFLQYAALTNGRDWDRQQAPGPATCNGTPLSGPHTLNDCKHRLGGVLFGSQRHVAFRVHDR